MPDRTAILRDALGKILRASGPVAVAFSGGADSSLLLRAARGELGEAGVLALTAVSPLFPAKEREEARAFCAALGVRQVEVAFDPFTVEGFARNPPDRCYLCKKNVFALLKDAAACEGFSVLCEGSNADDGRDYRPGARAIAELGVASPLKDVGFTKADVRALSREWGLPTADKPPFACLASRFVPGAPVTREGLLRVERAETVLDSLGFRQRRVRVRGSLACIEVLSGDLEKAFSLRGRIASALKPLGFTHVALDLEGYRTGSLNAGLPGVSAGIGKA
jgi:uncharacterized protein